MGANPMFRSQTTNGDGIRSEIRLAQFQKPVSWALLYGMNNYTTLSTAELRHRAGLFTIDEVSALLGIPIRRFRYLLESSRIGEPTTRIGRRRRSYYTLRQIDQIRRLIGEL